MELPHTVSPNNVSIACGNNDIDFNIDNLNVYNSVDVCSYHHFLCSMNARFKRLASIRNKALLSSACSIEYPPPPSSSICLEDVYDFSEWKKFTAGRPQTLVFFRGKTFTYSELPPFSKNKPKLQPKPRQKKKKAGTSSEGNADVLNVVSNSVVNVPNSVLNPLAPAFNVHFINANDCSRTLNEIRINNVGNIVIAHLNINSLRNKFYSLVELISNNIDILVIGETKLDATFPEKQFLITGFKKPYRRDRTDRGGGVMIYVRDDIPSQEKESNLPKNVEALLVEINLRKTRFLLIGTYHSTHETYGTTDSVFLHKIGTVLDMYSSYDKFLIVGDLNMQEGDACLDEFLDEFHARNLVKEPTCYKNPDNPSCVDLFITNGYRSFMKTTTVGTGLSDFHKMIITVMRTTFPKTGPKVVKYRDYSKYNSIDFGMDLERRLRNKPNTYDTFERIFLETLDFHAPQKSKVLRANHKPYVTKDMRKAIMLRSQLQNLWYTYKLPEYHIALKRQKNYCNRLYKRERKKFYSRLNLNDITDNSKFWKTMKPLFGDKGGAKEKIVLVEGDRIINEDSEVAQTFNDFFDGAVKSLGISENEVLMTNVETSQGKVLDAIKQFEAHPSILLIKENVVVDVEFSFSPVTLDVIHTELKALNIRKTIPFILVLGL